MSKNKYRFRQKAIDDLESIWRSTSKRYSIEQADKYYELIIQKIEFVAEHFYSGKSIDEIKKGYRFLQVKSHLIFYAKAPDGVIEIRRVLHQRMDFKRRLRGN